MPDPVEALGTETGNSAQELVSRDMPQWLCYLLMSGRTRPSYLTVPSFIHTEYAGNEYQIHRVILIIERDKSLSIELNTQ